MRTAVEEKRQVKMVTIVDGLTETKAIEKILI